MEYYESFIKGQGTDRYGILFCFKGKALGIPPSHLTTHSLVWAFQVCVGLFPHSSAVNVFRIFCFQYYKIMPMEVNCVVLAICCNNVDFLNLILLFSFVINFCSLLIILKKLTQNAFIVMTTVNYVGQNHLH